MMQDIYSEYNRQKEAVRTKRAKLEALIEANERALKKLDRMEKGWMELVVEPLAKELSVRMGDLPWKIYGPFGLGCETTIYLFCSDCHNIVKGETYSITVHPQINISEGNVNIYLTYNTGEIENKFAKGTIGYLNGFNNVEAKLPDSIDEIVKLLTHNYPSEQ